MSYHAVNELSKTPRKLTNELQGVVNLPGLPFFCVPIIGHRLVADAKTTLNNLRYERICFPEMAATPTLHCLWERRWGRAVVVEGNKSQTRVHSQYFNLSYDYTFLPSIRLALLSKFCPVAIAPKGFLLQIIKSVLLKI